MLSSLSLPSASLSSSSSSKSSLSSPSSPSPLLSQYTKEDNLSHFQHRLQYYGHREKLRVIGREDDLEKLNREALRIARAVADDTGTLMAGNICNSTVYQRDNPQAIKETEDMFSVSCTAGLALIVKVAHYVCPWYLNLYVCGSLCIYLTSRYIFNKRLFLHIRVSFFN